VWTVEQYRTAAKKALAAGNVAAAEELARAGMELAAQTAPQTADATPAKLQSDVATAPAGAVDPTPEEEAAAELKAHTAFEAANPTLAGKYKPGDRLPRAGDTVMGSGGGGRSGGARYTVQPYLAADISRAKDSFGGTASDMMAGPIDAAKAFGGGLTGGPSPSRSYLDADPAAGQLPGWIKAPVAGVGDLGGMLLSGLGAGVSGGIGLATELVPGQTDVGERRLGNDLLGMSQFAVPELAGVSSVAGMGARAGASTAAKAPVAAERVAAGLGPARAATVAPAAIKSAEDVAGLVVRAAGSGRGAEIAQKRLAALSKVNPEAKAAVDRLGIELPPDVLSDNASVRQFGGAVRSVVGSEDAAAWEGTVRGAISKADEAMASLGAGRDLASVSDNVKASLTSVRDDLRKQAGDIYNKVTEIVGPRTEVQLPKVREWLKNKAADVGGVDRLPAGLRGFSDMVSTDRPVTFAFLQQEKAELGASAYKPGSRYIDVGTKDARDLQRAMAEDQRAAVAAVGDDALRAEYEAAQALTARQKGLEEQIVAAFGKDQQGSIANALTGAITGGRSGNIAGLNRVLAIIPKELVPEALATALSSVTRSKRAVEPGFGFAEFAKTFGDIRDNKPVFNRITEALGKEGAQMLDDLLIASRRITEARGEVMGTGKAVLARDMLNNAAENVVSKVLANPVGRRVSQMAATGAAGAVGGVGGAAVAFPLVEALTRSSPKAVEAAGRMFRSDAFQRFANEAAAAPEVSAEIIEKFANHGAFRQWARAVALPDPRGWLAKAVVSPPASVKVSGAATVAQEAGAK
jgi:hypothetical protein